MRTQRSAYVLDATDMSARSAAGREITLIAAGTACPCGRNHDQSRKALVELLSQSKLLMDAELAIELRTLGIEELRPSHLRETSTRRPTPPADWLRLAARQSPSLQSSPKPRTGMPRPRRQRYRLPTSGRRLGWWSSTKAERRGPGSRPGRLHARLTSPERRTSL